MTSNISDNRGDAKTSMEDVARLLYSKAASEHEVSRRTLKDPYLSGADGQFLGTLCLDKKDEESIFNEYGVYGNKLSDVSIFNDDGTYGSETSIYSPFNELAQSPPRIMYKNRRMGYLSKNDHLEDAYDPDELFIDLKNYRDGEVDWETVFHRSL